MPFFDQCAATVMQICKKSRALKNESTEVAAEKESGLASTPADSPPGSPPGAALWCAKDPISDQEDRAFCLDEDEDDKWEFVESPNSQALRDPWFLVNEAYAG
mmetsp:Transcript_24129/g.45796  ORF Transcript_24129/g.45796 Transcript_24129/m.45796 type:complete len:103 (-) Transcript_24129:26-334(-)